MGQLPSSLRGHEEVVSLLLADPRIDPNKPRTDQSSPLWVASQNGRLGVVQHLLASRREINTKMRSKFNNKTAAEQGRVKVQGPPSQLRKRRRFSKEGRPTVPSALTSLMTTSAILWLLGTDSGGCQACENTSLATSSPSWSSTLTPSWLSTRRQLTPTPGDSSGSRPGFPLICKNPKISRSLSFFQVLLSL